MDWATKEEMLERTHTMERHHNSINSIDLVSSTESSVSYEFPFISCHLFRTPVIHNRVTEDILAMSRPNAQIIQERDIVGQFVR